MKSLIQSLSLGLTVIASILVPTLIGLAADRAFAIRPAGVICGVVIGALSAFGALIQLVRQGDKDEK